MKTIEKKTHTIKQIELKLGGGIEEILRSMYVDQNLPVKVIAKTLGVSYATAHKWIKLAGIRSRRLRVDKG